MKKTEMNADGRADMKRGFQRVYQFKINLNGIRPPVWRRIQVPETYTFWDLHVAVQDAMGWLDYHLHCFEIVNPITGLGEEIGIPNEDWQTECLAGWDEQIKIWFSPENAMAQYTYDFGDDWQHTVKLEKILKKDDGARYPRCIAGKRACPPEDCGGVWGYQHFLDAIMDPTHKEYEELLDWVGGDFDPEYFDISEIHFDNPTGRLKIDDLF
jgi:hypothetical protein